MQPNMYIYTDKILHVRVDNIGFIFFHWIGYGGIFGASEELYVLLFIEKLIASHKQESSVSAYVWWVKNKSQKYIIETLAEGFVPLCWWEAKERVRKTHRKIIP